MVTNAYDDGMLRTGNIKYGNIYGQYLSRPCRSSYSDTGVAASCLHGGAVASEAICKWGAECRREAPAENFLMCPLTFLLCPPHEGTQRLFVTDRETIEVVKSGEGQ